MGDDSDKTSKILVIILIVLLLISSSVDYLNNLPSEGIDGDEFNNYRPVDSSFNDIEPNFELDLLVHRGNRLGESYSFAIKQMLAPLGIDVTIRAVDSTRLNEILNGKTNSISEFSSYIDGSEVEMIVNYDTGFNYYRSPSFLYLKSSPFHFSDIFTNENSVKIMLPSGEELNIANYDSYLGFIDLIESVLSISDKNYLIDQFSRDNMNSKLFKIPLPRIMGDHVIWRGFGGSNGELYNPSEGILDSLKLGANWSNYDHLRNQKYALDELNLPLSKNLETWLFNPVIPNLYYPAYREIFASPLVEIDPEYKIHPSIAYQWYQEDYQFNSSTIIDGRNIFLLNANNTWQFNEATAVNGTTVSSHPLNANDYATTLEMYKQLANESYINQFSKPEYLLPRVPDWFQLINTWNVTSTISTNDTLIIDMDYNSLNTIDYLAELYPLPHHIIYDSVNANTSVPIAYNQNFRHLSTPGGMSTVGPYQLNIPLSDISIGSPDTDLIRYDARDDFPFPNEQMTVDMLSNLSSPLPYVQPIFAPHLYSELDYHYWNFNDKNETTAYEKASHSISIINLKYDLSDTNKRLLTFENGEIDYFHSALLGENTVESYQNEQDYQTYSEGVFSKHQYYLQLNLNNPHLQIRDVRYAIASAINQNLLTKVNDNLSQPTASPVALYYESNIPSSYSNAMATNYPEIDEFWYSSHPVPYNYTKARDLMRKHDYDARDTNIPDDSDSPPPVENVLGGLNDSQIMWEVLFPELPLVILVLLGYRYGKNVINYFKLWND